MTATESPPGATPHGTGRGRLARSRLALLDYFAHTPGAAPPAPDSSEAPSASGPTFWRSAREAACHYWEGHPARLLLALASPVISRWGQRHPLAFVAGAAGAGALLVLARPWKLISVSSVLLAALKSPHLSSLAMSILTRGGTRTRD
jgi:hypothetical protein